MICEESLAWEPDETAHWIDPAVREAVFHKEFREDLQFWVNTDRKTALKVLSLVEAAMRDPATGIGNPEPMRYMGGDIWSRRITQEHRLVYAVSDDRIDFLQARYHYQR